MAEAGELPMKAVTAGPGLVAEIQPPATLGQPFTILPM